MVEFATFSDLERITGDIPLHEQRSLQNKASNKSEKDTFLSHSSKDAKYLPAVIRILNNHGASVYCDLDDGRLPDNPSPETAQFVRNQIDASRRLVVFITKNSKDSKWVPWELGIADSGLGMKNVAIFPAAQSSNEQIWARQEYLGIYRQIVWGRMKGEAKNRWIVLDHRKNIATGLRDWCRS